MNQEKFAEQFFHKRFDNQPKSSSFTTISYYCPDDKTATKVTLRIIDSKNEIMELRS